MKDSTIIKRLFSEQTRRVLSYLKKYRSLFLTALLCMVIYGASDGVLPYLVKHIFDGIFSGNNQELLYILPVILILFSLIRAVTDFGQKYLMAKVGHLVVKDLRNDLNQHILNLSPDYFIAHSSGNILSRITSDVVLVKTLLTDSTSAFLRDAIRIVALLIAALSLDPMLALIAFVAFPIGIYPVIRFGKKMRRLSKTGQDAIGGASSLLQESIHGNKIVKIFGREQYEQDKFEVYNQELTKTFIKTEKISAIISPINEVLASFAISGVILYGGYSVIAGTRTQGDFIAFLIAVFLLYDPFKKLSRVHTIIQQGLSGAERVFEVLDAKPGVVTPQHPQPIVGTNAVTFEGVSFSYKDQRSPAVNNINLEIPENSKVALVGLSGSGKSTLVDLIPRFMDPQAGRILIGQTDIKQASLKELRQKIAMVNQHTFLFNESIYYNIAYGHDDATKEQVIEAAKAAHAYDFIMNLPHQFDTLVGESGFSLSGGERQRVAIARAILKDSPILIMDEATASLDNHSEREVQKALEALEKGRTSIIIAHRLSTVRNADFLVVMQGGNIVERGTHDELLALGGEYNRLYELQFAEKKL